MLDNILKNLAIFPFCEENTYIAVCPGLGTVDSCTTLESAFINLQKTTQVYLQAANLNITPVLIGANQLNFTSLSLPQISSGRFITALERLRFRRTSHCVVFLKQSEICEIICVVPLRIPLASTTILNLLYSAGTSRSEFLENLYDSYTNNKQNNVRVN